MDNFSVASLLKKLETQADVFITNVTFSPRGFEDLAVLTVKVTLSCGIMLWYNLLNSER
jgi:hypothetical protein